MSWFEFIPRDRLDGAIGESSSVHRWLFHVFGVVSGVSREASCCMIIPGPIRGRDVTLRRPVNCFLVCRGWSWVVSTIKTRKRFSRRPTAWLSTVPEERIEQVWGYPCGRVGEVPCDKSHGTPPWTQTGTIENITFLHSSKLHMRATNIHHFQPLEITSWLVMSCFCHICDVTDFQGIFPSVLDTHDHLISRFWETIISWIETTFSALLDYLNKVVMWKRIFAESTLNMTFHHKNACFRFCYILTM